MTRPTTSLIFIIFLCTAGAILSDAAACQSCVFLAPHYHHRKSSAALWGQVSNAVQQATRGVAWKNLAVHKVSRAVTTKPVLAVAAVGATTCFVRHRRWLTSSSSAESSDPEGAEQEGESETQEKPVAEEALSGGMIAALGFYKQIISPLLPPACRFVPTCSQYGVQAIKEFGPGKGSVLIAWRLLRCSPFGGKGYDPPKWPPVPYQYGQWDFPDL